MKTTKYRFLIGQNNQTRKREFKKSYRVMTKNNIIGFSITKTDGFYNGEIEKSFIIEAIADEKNGLNKVKAFKIRDELKTELKQYSVGLDITPTDTTF